MALEHELTQQFELEKWWVEGEHKRAVNSLDLLNNSNLTKDTAARNMLSGVADKFAVTLQEAARRRYSRKAKFLQAMIDGVGVEELSYLVVFTVAPHILTSRMGYVTLSVAMGSLTDSIKQEYRLRLMESVDPELPGIVSKVTQDARSSYEHRKRVFINLFNKRHKAYRLPEIFDSQDSETTAGLALLETLAECSAATHVFKFTKQYDKKMETSRWVIRFTDEARNVILHNWEAATWINRFISPLGLTIYQPPKLIEGKKRDTSLLTRQVPPIRMSSFFGKNTTLTREALESSEGYGHLLASLNHLESVRYRINKPMLEWVESNTDVLKELGIYPDVDGFLPDPPFPKGYVPKDDIEHKRLSEWKAMAEGYYNKRYKQLSKIAKVVKTMVLANKMAEYEGFHFTWCADFRGRLYTVNQALSPQTNHLAKSLVEFHNHTEIQIGRGRGWGEFIDYGYRLNPEHSKKSFRQISELQSPSELHNLVALFSEDPKLAIQQWRVKPKEIYPFVAWVLELSVMLPKWGQTFKTHHPIRRDATCSSMQHMAALSGDLKVCQLTNAANPTSDVVRDLYEEMVPDYEEKGLKRDWIKHFVMTMAYNGTDYQRKKDIQAFFEKEFGTPMPYKEAATANDDVKEAALAALGKVTKLQHYFMEIYKFLVNSEGGLAWATNPMGLVIDSNKFKQRRRRVRLRINGLNVRLALKDLDAPPEELDNRKSRQSWVANIIHALDACLLHIVFSLMAETKDARIDVFPIHDCIQTRPGEMGKAVGYLGSAFRNLYRPHPSTGVSLALHRMLRFWALDTDNPTLYDSMVEELQANPEETYQNLPYLFI